MQRSLLAVLFLCAAASAQPAARTDPSWLDGGVRGAERQSLEQAVGKPAPAFPDTLTWLGGTGPSSESLRGSVVVVQTWSRRDRLGQAAYQRLEQFHAGADPAVRVIAVHTAEGAENVEDFFSRRKAPFPVAVDADGSLATALGVGERPMNVVIDKAGVVRYVGLSVKGLTEATRLLAQEAYEPPKPAPRAPARQAPRRAPAGEAPAGEPTKPADPATKQPASAPSGAGGGDAEGVSRTGANAGFPGSATPVRYARDRRGERAPDIAVQEWLTPQPAATAGKVTVVGFWATWCPPCRESIPHLNELTREMGADAVIIAVSDEQPRVVRAFLDRTEMRYAVGVDQAKRMSTHFGLEAIPHAVVFSPDGVVRWQGFPSALTAETLREIARLSAAPTAPEGEGRPARRR